MSILLQKIINVFNLSKIIINDGLSVRVLITKTWKVFKGEGLQGVKLRIVAINRRRISAHNMALELAAHDLQNIPAEIEGITIRRAEKSLFIPHYFDPATAVEDADKIKLAVHIHADSAVNLLASLSRFKVLPANTDIYLSYSFVYNTDALKDACAKELPNIGELITVKVPAKVGALLPLLVEFVDVLAHYDVIGHFQTSALSMDQNAFDSLLGVPDSEERLASIFALLKHDATSVFNGIELNASPLSEQYTESLATIAAIIESKVNVSLLNLSHDLPAGSMFWSKPSILNDWLDYPLTYQLFSVFSPGHEKAISHAITSAICLLSQSNKGRNYYLPLTDTLLSFTQYEEQHDYSESIVHEDIQILSYYLPQFHPIPENDLWHGKGFTEWTKVKAANPLFKGHYQQQIPHQDVGYYLLDSPDTLRKQANMMKRAGVQGQVFYHYWFGGKLILEEPAQMLLDNPDIQMPFSFCWANENWTMRWDGNDDDVLLAQNYSAEDARAFIQYLIPFFLDKRYLKIEGRPAIWVYRPSHITNVQQYIDIWAQECAKYDLPAPYVIAVMTRGITDPKTYAMDAGVERILHDWTDGVVHDIKLKLETYHDMTGSVLDYNHVADFYEAQKDSKAFTYFRSLVPIWDNTARYNEKALLLHGGSPERFQQWLESNIAYSKQNLATDKRFVVINAWNEWAEGAHLEPDTCHGYGYLNAIGRALSSIKFGDEPSGAAPGVNDTHLHIELAANVVELLKSNAQLKQQFVTCLHNTSLLKKINFSFEATDIISNFGTNKPADNHCLTLRFTDTVLFTQDTLEDMFNLWQQCPTSAIVSNHYANNSQQSLRIPTSNGSIDRALGCQSPIILFLNSDYKNVRLCTQAQSFGLLEDRPRAQPDVAVSTIIRFHEGGDLRQLRAALYCLAAMRDCSVYPIIAGQGLRQETLDKINVMLTHVPFTSANIAKVIPFNHTENIDLRSKMLNEALQQVDTRYAAFLDYDDLLLPDAYSWLLTRLNMTGKAVAFGRVFKTDYLAEDQLLLKRVKQFEFGGSYEDFLYNNHAPLHSFMLDLTQLHVKSVKYYDEHKYMEDYFLALQLFTADNCDWQSLSLNKYIGDYIYSVDREHTLAFNDDGDKTEILKDAHYTQCEQRINDLRQPIYKALTAR